MEPVATGVPGLDKILRGGLRPLALHVVGGLPGTGKTTLAQQIGYHHAKQGGKVLYLGALSETGDRLVSHAGEFSFFDPAMVAHRFYYISIYSKLEEGGLPAVLDDVRRLAMEHRATLVCLDGISTLKAAATSPLDFRRFVYDFNSQLRSIGATSLVLGPWVEWEASDPEFAVADGIFALTAESGEGHSERWFEVLKLRGTGHLAGRHSMSITSSGLSVFPRLEAGLSGAEVGQPPSQWSRIGTGSSGLDEMLMGGLPSSSVTLVAGATGTGKTVLGISFLAEGAGRGEKGLYVGFDESPSRLVPKAEALGFPLGELERQGTIRFMWQPAFEVIPDRIAWELLDLVDNGGYQRVVLDGLDRLLPGSTIPGRQKPFLAALTARLKARGVTALFTNELPRLMEPGFEEWHRHLGAGIDNNIMLQYVELRSELRRLISILKVRESDFDHSIRQFTIGQGGLQVSSTFDSTEAVLTGTGRWLGGASQ